MIEAHRIIFPAKLQACLEHYAFEDSAEHDNEIVIETAFSVVNSGTELVASQTITTWARCRLA